MPQDNEQWLDVADDVAVWMDQDLTAKAKDHLDSLPAYDELVGWDAHLTSQDILSRMAEHGMWWAVEFEDYPFADIDEPSLCEVGVYVAWFSESLAPDLDGPGYAAGVVLGYPAHPESHWAVDDIEDAVIAYTPEHDADGNCKDAEVAMRNLFDVLCGIWERL